jgi:hypothetical protein
MADKRIESVEELTEKINQIERFLEERKKAKKEMIKFPSKFIEETDEDIPANVILAEAFDQLDDVIIGGIDKNGDWWFSLSTGDGAYALWILEHFRKTLLESSQSRNYNEGRDI